MKPTIESFCKMLSLRTNKNITFSNNVDKNYDVKDIKKYDIFADGKRTKLILKENVFVDNNEETEELLNMASGYINY